VNAYAVAITSSTTKGGVGLTDRCSVYSVIIASDEHEVLGDEEDDQVEGEGQALSTTTSPGARSGVGQKEAADAKPRSKKKRASEYGISRGIGMPPSVFSVSRFAH
jgi:hypothetical protein